MLQHHVSRRGLLATAPALLIAVGCAQAAKAQEIVGCCQPKWIWLRFAPAAPRIPGSNDQVVKET